MTLARIAILTAILSLFLAACTPQTGVAQRVRDLPGVHVAWTSDAPAGFEPLTLAQTQAAHKAGQDIWLYAPTTTLSDNSNEDSPAKWLAAQTVFHFPADQLHWIPAQTKTEPLSYLQQHQLLDALDATQRSQLWRSHGDNLRMQNDFMSAIAAYQEALKALPNDVESNAGLGAAYLGLGRASDAVPPLQRAAANGPNHYWAHRLLGTSYLNLQRYALASDELTQAYLLAPDDPSLLPAVALAQGRSGQKDLALRTLSQLEERSTDPTLLDTAKALREEFSAP